MDKMSQTSSVVNGGQDSLFSLTEKINDINRIHNFCIMEKAKNLLILMDCLNYNLLGQCGHYWYKVEVYKSVYKLLNNSGHMIIYMTIFLSYTFSLKLIL